MEYDDVRDLFFTRFTIPTYTTTLPDQTDIIVEGLQVNIFLDIKKKIR